jgi:hypothetical protein
MLSHFEILAEIEGKQAKFFSKIYKGQVKKNSKFFMLVYL